MSLRRLSGATLRDAGRFSAARYSATASGTSAAEATRSTVALTARACATKSATRRSEEHTSELQSLMRISYAVFCLKKKKKEIHQINRITKPHTNRTESHSKRINTIY